MHEARPYEALVYRRISDDREGREHGVTRQEQDCRAYCEARGWPVREIYTDNDIGASTRTRSKKAREQYARLLERVAAGRPGQYAIVAYSNSRLTRRPLELETLITLHERTQVLIATVKSGTDDLSTADGRMVARIKASVDAAEAERTAERVARAAQERRIDGRLHGGPPIFGYLPMDRKAGIGYCQVIDEPAAAAIRRGIEMVLSGEKLVAVGRLWNELGFTTTHGKLWLLSGTISKALASPRIAGFTAHKGAHGTELLTEGNWPAIIDRATYEAVRDALKPMDDRHKGKTKRKYLLSGFVYCLCGLSMVAQVHEPTSLNRYMCTKQRGGCGKVSRDRLWLENAVLAYVAGRIEAGHQEAEAPGNDRVAELEREIAAKEAEIGRLRDALAAGVFTLAEVSERIVPLRAEMDTLRGRQNREVRSAVTSKLTTAEALDVWTGDQPGMLAERRAVLAEHVARIMVKPLSRGGWGAAAKPVPADSIEIIAA